MELPVDDRIHFIGIETEVYRKSTNAGLLLHFHIYTRLTLQPVYVSKKLEQDLKPKEAKRSIVNLGSYFG